MNPISAKIIERGGRVLSLATIRAQCEVLAIDGSDDSHPDDQLLLAYLDAATDHAEKFTGRAIKFQTFEFALDCFPPGSTWINGTWPFPTGKKGIEVPYPPLVEVISFTAGDDSESELELGESFTVDTYGDKAVLRPVTVWPTVTAAPNLIKFRYVAGYQSEEDPSSDAEPLPGGIKSAILLMVGHLYLNREAVNVGNIVTEFPLGVEALLRPWRVLTGMA